MNTKVKEEINWGNVPINRQTFYIVLNACLINLNKARMAYAINKRLSFHDKKELYLSLSRVKFKDKFEASSISTSYLNKVIQEKDPWGYIEAFQNKFKWILLAVLGVSFVAALVFLFSSTLPGKEIMAVAFLAIASGAIYGVKNFPEIFVKSARRNVFFNNLYILKFLKKASSKLEKSTDKKNNLKYKLDALLGAKHDFPMIQAYQTYWGIASDLERFSPKHSTTMENLFRIKEEVLSVEAPISEKLSLELYATLVELLNNDNPATLTSVDDGSPTLWLELTHIMDTILYNKRDSFYHITETPKLIGKLEADYAKFVEITILLLIKEKQYSVLYAMVLEMFTVSSFKILDDWDHLCDKYNLDIEVLLSCVNRKNQNYFDNLRDAIIKIKNINDEAVQRRHLKQIYALIPNYAYEKIGLEFKP